MHKPSTITQAQTVEQQIREQGDDYFNSVQDCDPDTLKAIYLAGMQKGVASCRQEGCPQQAQQDATKDDYNR